METRKRTCAGLYVFGRGFRIDPPEYDGDLPIPQIVGPFVDSKAKLGNGLRAISNAMQLSILLLLGACGPRAQIPQSPVSLERALAPLDSGAVLARRLAPVLYVTPDEKFPLERVVAVIHPSQRIIAYNLLWRDDVHGSWVPRTIATDQEIVWVGYDRNQVPTDVWTYWHGFILHMPWKKRQVSINVQWGKHGSMPRGMNLSDLPPTHSLKFYYGATMFGLPDILLGDLTRSGPFCFCHTYGQYLNFSVPIKVSERINVVVREEDPERTLRAVFGPYSRKPFWPVGF